MRLGFDVVDVGAVAQLGHRKAARQIKSSCAGQVAAVVTLGAEHQDASSEQTELDSEFDEQT